ncbi:UDP-glucose 4-epimerase GalE [Alistipes sp. OttesenSCG-928-B03]|nr:UDP-glucose 4-epimerase GalE [Alistipes sp. OttesenSCG-928-B03]
MKKKILVTGGAGYIGSHTTVELIAAGYDVVIVDNLVNSEVSAVEAVRAITGVDVLFVEADCCDRRRMAEIFAANAFDAVIHFAALKSVPQSVAQPLEYYDNNLTSFINILSLAKEYGVRDIVFSSSATVYGQPDTLPATEQTPRKPATSPYGETKQMCEDILASAVREGLRGISLRYFNPIGAHPSATMGELPRGVPGNLVPFITQTAAGLHTGLKIFGDDYNTPDGTALRDYLDVVDLARAHVAALARLFSGDGTDYEVFNVGTGIPVSVMELVRKFEAVNGVKVPYELTGRRDGDVEAVWADPALANRVLGWKAERTIEQTLAAAWAWEKRLRGL